MSADIFATALFYDVKPRSYISDGINGLPKSGEFMEYVFDILKDELLALSAVQVIHFQKIHCPVLTVVCPRLVFEEFIVTNMRACGFNHSSDCSRT